MEWISVKEKMPVSMEPYSYYQESGPIAFTNGKGIFVGHVQVFTSTRIEEPRWFIELHNENEDIMNIYGVTHWMPLPTLPTRKGDERKGD